MGKNAHFNCLPKTLKCLRPALPKWDNSLQMMRKHQGEGVVEGLRSLILDCWLSVQTSVFSEYSICYH